MKKQRGVFGNQEFVADFNYFFFLAVAKNAEKQDMALV